jgi:hypothetical protein
VGARGGAGVVRTLRAGRGAGAGVVCCCCCGGGGVMEASSAAADD